MRLQRIEPKTQSGDEPFRAGKETLGFTLQDYWRWSGSELMSNVARGVMAEYLVAKALGLTDAPREEFGEFDVEVPRCGTVEVKSAAYIQSWKQKDYSRISFDIAKKKSAWNPKTGKERKLDPPERIADVYVFCLLKHKCQETIDPLDVEQWEFFVVPRSKLDHEDWKDRKSIGLKSLVGLTKRNGSIGYEELKDEVLGAMPAQRNSAERNQSAGRPRS